MHHLHWLSDHDSPEVFPPVEQALLDPPGLLAAGGDLSPERLLAAYRRGIFPWYSHGQPILWWSPDPRTVLLPQEFKVSRSLAKSARNRGFDARFDSSFAAVMAGCGDRSLRPEGTWITREMQMAYLELHRLGLAHSMETWQDGNLVGGLYGVQLGRVFFGESMFSRVTDASKFALKMLCERLLDQGVAVIDCQMATPHLSSLGAREISRREFLDLLHRHVA
ncbi:MAG: leucyl/phenylalanyl-tRNA--protein transferase [Steroidobacteraceae bacterium]